MAIKYPSFRLDNKIAVITGGERGLGKWIALGYADAGANVCIIGLIEEDLEETASEIIHMGGNVSTYICDVQDEKIMKTTLETINEQHGGLDILVNNAGVSLKQKSLEVGTEELDHTFSINYKSVFFTGVKAANVMMKNGNGGRIINMSSAASFLVRPSQYRSVYSSTKAAVNQLTKVWAAEWAEYDINVNALAPGYFDTSMARNVMKDQSVIDAMMYTTPKKRIGLAEDVIGPAIFLASESSDFVTGQIIPIDGGRTVI